MKKSLSGLADLVGQDVIIRVERKGIDEHRIDGFVVAVSDGLMLLHLVEGNTLLLNGYSALRLRDISSWRTDETFVPRALRLLERRPALPDGVSLTDWPSLIASAQQQFPLVMIETEKKTPGCGYIGLLVKQTKRHAVLKEVSPKGLWEENETTFASRDITQVKFGDGYIQSLAALVAHEAAAGEFAFGTKSEPGGVCVTLSGEPSTASLLASIVRPSAGSDGVSRRLVTPSATAAPG